MAKGLRIIMVLHGGGILAAEIPDFAGFFLADTAGEIRGAETCVEATYLRPCLAETCVFGGDREIAYNLKNISAAYCIAVYHGDDRLYE